MVDSSKNASDPRDYTLANFRMFANEDQTTLRLFIEAFIIQAKAELHHMNQFLAMKEFSAIGEIAHKLRNTFGQLEAKKALILLGKLERLTVDPTFDENQISSQIDELQLISAALFLQLEEDMKP